MATTFAASWRSDERPTTSTPRRQRSEGRVRIAAGLFGVATRVADLAEGGAMRLRVPRGGPGLQAVIVNTAGGVCCGDRFTIEASAGPSAHLTVSTPAAEKVYRSDGPMAEISVTLSAADGARLEWLPQETILFDRARLKRRYEVDMAPGATFLSFEGLMLGRLAHGDRMEEGHIDDHWRVRRGGDLVFADAFRLSGPIGRLLKRPAVAAGGRALATLLYIAPDAESRLEEARAHLDGVPCEAGASAWNGILAVRWLAPDIGTLRRAATSFLMAFRKSPLPRVWAT